MRTVGRVLGRLAPFMIVLVAAGCTEPPTKEMNQAQGAIDAARAAGAAEFATEEFTAAEAALARSHQAVDERDYRLALNHALDARDRAQTAAAQAADEKARVRTEADRALLSVDAALARTHERLAAATALKVPPRALAASRTQMEAAEATITAARAAFDKGDYRQTLSLLRDITARLTATSSEIDAVAEARQPRRPARRNRS
jgi:hypothetical protein